MDLSYEQQGSESWRIPVYAVVKVIVIRKTVAPCCIRKAQLSLFQQCYYLL